MEFDRDYQPKNRDFLKKQGFYIVLFLCLLIVGTAIALTALPRETEPEQQPVEQQPVVIDVRQSTDETLQKRNTPLPTATPAPTAAPTPTVLPTDPPRRTSAPKKGLCPVSGDVITVYAVEQLIYSRTLNQWTTHAGVDLSAEAGSDVKAAFAGTVERVYEDDALGHCVLISHTNDRQSIYGNLDEAIAVTEGQKVNAGDVIGKVGASAISECAELPHLHFGFLVEGKTVDPTLHINIAH